VSRRSPLINPDMIKVMDLFFPYIEYPYEEIREKAENIRKKHFGDLSIKQIMEKNISFTKEYASDCKDFKDYLNQLTIFPINADDSELIGEFEKLNGVTINIFTLNQEAYSEDCTKKLHELWNARYITSKPARLIETEKHIDLMLIKKVDGYKYDEKLKASIPNYMNHYIMFLNSIELATDQRRKNVHTLQCIRCKKHFRGRTRESTKGLLHFHEKNEECIDRSITYNIPHDRELKYEHYYTAYCKDYVFICDLEAINKKIRDEKSEGYNREVDKNFTEVDEFDFKHNEKIAEHEVVSAMFIVIANDSKLNLNESHDLFGKTFMFKGRNSREVLREFMRGLKNVSDVLNRELEVNYSIDRIQLINQMDEIKTQTECFVCGKEFFGEKDVHLHHDHKREKNNIIGRACARCNLSMTEKRRSGIPVIFHNGSGYDWKFLMQELGSIIEESMDVVEDITLKRKFEQVDVLGLNSENFITFKWNNMWFIDSFKFQSASLSKLVNNLSKDDMKMIKRLFELHGLTPEQIEILR